MPAATKKVRGFVHACPRCGRENSLQVELGDTDVLSCSECDETMGAEDLRARIAEWQALLDWLETAPERGE